VGLEVVVGLGVREIEGAQQPRDDDHRHERDAQQPLTNREVLIGLAAASNRRAENDDGKTAKHASETNGSAPRSQKRSLSRCVLSLIVRYRCGSAGGGFFSLTDRRSNGASSARSASRDVRPVGRPAAHELRPHASVSISAPATGANLSIATHDPVIREALLAALPGTGVEMLLGVRPADARDLLKRSQPVCVYVLRHDWLRSWLR